MTKARLTLLILVLTVTALWRGPAFGQDVPTLTLPGAETTWGFWKPDGLFYSGRVTKTSGDLKYFVFDDGDAAWLPAEEIVSFDLEPGDHVHVNLLGRGSFYPAKVLSSSGGRIRVKYDEDGTTESTTIRYVRLRLAIEKMLTPGRRVFARWEADGKFYPGTIREQRTASWLVEYDDGVTEWLEFADLSLLTIHGGMWLECRWLGRPLYYAAQVLSIHGEKVRVEYEDGTVEDTTVSMLRQSLISGRN